MAHDERLFSVPRSSLCVFPQVLEEYALEELPDLKAPRVLDVGANVGAFSWFAMQRWPGARCVAVEPHPRTFELLRANLEGIAETVQAAVVHPKKAETAKLFEGKNASTEASLRDDVRWPHVSQDLDRSVDVPLIDASELSAADVLKVDTEGSEVEILTGYRHMLGVEVLLVEAHAVGGDLLGQVRQIGELAKAAGLHPVDIRGTTIRFVRDPGAVKRVAEEDKSYAPDDPTEGEWVEIETVAGSHRFGRVVDWSDGGNSSRYALDPCFHISPTRFHFPVPVPGQGVEIKQLDTRLPFVWGSGDKEIVWAASVRPISHARAGELLRVEKRIHAS